MILALLAVASAATPSPTPAVNQVLAGLEKSNWAAFYERAGPLLQKGQTESAAIAFYAGQFRARASLLCNKSAPDAGPALMASLNEVIGGPINKAVGQSVRRWLGVIDVTLDWTDRHPDPETPLPRCATAIRKVRDGLVKLRAMIAADPAAIRAGRAENGLPNDPE
jgi:hypothetical protein